MFVNTIVHAYIRAYRTAYGIGCYRVLYNRRMTDAKAETIPPFTVTRPTLIFLGGQNVRKLLLY